LTRAAGATAIAAAAIAAKAGPFPFGCRPSRSCSFVVVAVAAYPSAGTVAAAAFTATAAWASAVESRTGCLPLPSAGTRSTTD